MKTARILSSLAAVVLVTGINASGQSQFQFTFRGTCWTTNQTGRFVSRRVDNQSLIQDYVQANGVTNSKTLALVYPLNIDDRGDTIEVVNTATGAVVYPLYSLFF